MGSEQPGAKTLGVERQESGIERPPGQGRKGVSRVQTPHS
jgi:hypothetical protein